MATVVERLADFATQVKFRDLPQEVVSESRRILLDSVGCALAGLSVEKGKVAVRVARQIHSKGKARIIGIGDKVSPFAASFANGELINSMDYDVLTVPPGHVTPYVLPAAQALAEEANASGMDVLLAVAVAHEVSARFGRALDYYRDVKGDRIEFPAITGFSSTIFGGTLAAGMLLGLNRERLAHALGIAGLIVPAQTSGASHRAVPAVTPKYLMAGWMCQAVINATLLAQEGGTGDMAVLDGDHGFWRYAGSSRWNPEAFASLGREWRMPSITVYKPYPCGRVSHTVLDCFRHIAEANRLKPEEIEKVNVYIDTQVIGYPIFHNKRITTHLDAQFSVSYHMAVAAFGIRPGPEWQDPATMANPRILAFMDKVNVSGHPGFVQALKEDSGSRLGKVEVTARGRVFTEERRYRKGSPATPETKMTDAELVDKFKHNASRVLTPAKADRFCRSASHLEEIGNVNELLKHCVGGGKETP